MAVETLVIDEATADAVTVETVVVDEAAPVEAAASKGRSRRPGADGPACALHGGVLGGELCQGEGDCVAGHLCVAIAGDTPRCRPLCRGDTGGCDCRPVAAGLSVCR